LWATPLITLLRGDFYFSSTPLLAIPSNYIITAGRGQARFKTFQILPLHRITLRCIIRPAIILDLWEAAKAVRTSYTPPPKVQKAVHSLLASPATCAPELRHAIEAYAATLSGAARQLPETGIPIPPDLLPYLKKVALHAYKITDEDVQHLKAAGYSEDTIFEITLCAAVGAGLARMEQGLLALKGASDALAGS
jgi:hypothetical protein